MQKKNCGARTLFSASLGSRILSKLRETWSPEQIAGRLFHEQGPSYSTIYRWIYKGFIKSDLGVLRQKGKRQKPRETRGRFNIGLPISKPGSRDLWTLGVGYCRIRVGTDKGMCRDIHRTQKPVLHRTTDARSFFSLDGTRHPKTPWFLPIGNVPNHDQRIVARSSAVTNGYRTPLVFRCTSQILILHGSAAVTRMLMVFFVSSSQRERTSERSTR